MVFGTNIDQKNERDHKLWERAALDFIHFVKGNRGKEKDVLRTEILFPVMLNAMGDVRGKRVLDAGCGEGSFSQILEEKGALVHGFDVSSVMVQAANNRKKKFNLHAEFKQADIEDIDLYEIGMFDVVVLSMVLFELDEAEEAFRNMIAYLKPNGRVVVSLLHPAFDMNDSQRMALGNLADSKMTRANWSFEIQHPYNEEIRYERSYSFTDKAVPYYFRPINYYVKMYLKNSIKINVFEEPLLKHDSAMKNPQINHTHYVPRFLILGGDKE